MFRMYHITMEKGLDMVITTTLHNLSGLYGLLECLASTRFSSRCFQSRSLLQSFSRVLAALGLSLFDLQKPPFS